MSNDETVTQLSFEIGIFRNEPRVEREVDVSLLRGKLSAGEAMEYVLRERPTDVQQQNASVRVTTAGRLRDAGFGVIHTPGRIATSGHISVVWPATMDAEHQQAPWPADVVDDFDECFTRNGGL